MKRPSPVAVLGAAVTLVVAAALAFLAYSWYESRLPGTYNVMDFGRLDYGGGSEPQSGSQHGGHAGAISVETLRDGTDGPPDARFELTARKASVRLPSGATVDALTFDGTVPGPELRVQQGDLVEVLLRNQDVEDGVTIHWHGVDVPNAEDGVAGVTQDVVTPGESYTYRFRAEQVGTFWYHSHQVGSEQVRRGLFGAFVIEPAEEGADRLDLALVSHDLDGFQTLNGRDGATLRQVAPGTDVRLRLVNTDNTRRTFSLAGTPFHVVAIDGTDLNGPTPIERQAVGVAAGGRVDLAFAMPDRPVELGVESGPTAIALSPDGKGRALAPVAETEFDPLGYGTPAATPFGASSQFDRRFELRIGRKPGFLDGRPGFQWTLNGGIYPDVPVFVVEEGDLVAITIENDSGGIHPMHLHGHHLLVLSRDGTPSTGSPWWTDTLDVRDGEHYEVAFRANNPGLWMDHCHNLRHAAAGLTMHVAYAGVSTPFLVGGHAHNRPE